MFQDADLLLRQTNLTRLGLCSLSCAGSRLLVEQGDSCLKNFLSVKVQKNQPRNHSVVLDRRLRFLRFDLVFFSSLITFLSTVRSFSLFFLHSVLSSTRGKASTPLHAMLQIWRKPLWARHANLWRRLHSVKAPPDWGPRRLLRCQIFLSIERRAGG